jgi:hypothetical protein
MTVECAVVRLRALAARQSARLISNRPIKCSGFFLGPVYSFPLFLTYSRSCNEHAPLLIQKGRARAGQKVQPRRVRQNSALDSSTALGEGKMFLANVIHKVSTYSHNLFSHLQKILTFASPSLRGISQHIRLGPARASLGLATANLPMTSR